VCVIINVVNARLFFNRSSSQETDLVPEWSVFCCGTQLYTSGDRLYAGVFAFTATVYDIFVRGTTAVETLCRWLPVACCVWRSLALITS
jgi:hypothetical protein